MYTIKQRRFFTKREYNILDNKLHFKTSYIGGEGESIISFENITKEKTTYKSQNSAILIISLFIYTFALVSFLIRKEKDVDPDMWIACTFIASTLMIVYVIMRENSWKIRLYNNGYLYIFKNIPHKNFTDEFISTLFAELDKYLKEIYLSLDPNLSYNTQINDLKWLRSVEAVSKEEFDKYYEELKLLYAPKKGSIGFER